jgi:hypothetical protein
MLGFTVSATQRSPFHSKTMPCRVQGWGQYALVVITPTADNNIVLDKVCRQALYIQGHNFSGLNLAYIIALLEPFAIHADASPVVR